jgi:hypothetical protein
VTNEAKRNEDTVEPMVRCTICGIDGPKDDSRFLPLFVIGSEGVTACMECRMALTDCATHLMRVARKCHMAGYKACKQVHAANATHDGRRPRRTVDGIVGSLGGAE